MKRTLKEELLLKSPFKLYCEQQDKKIYEDDLLDSDITRMAHINYAKNPQFIRQAYKEEMHYRAKYRLNTLGSIEGEQGTGKSIFTGDLVLNTSSAFNVPFSFSNNLFFLPETFINKIPNNLPRSTNWMDELKKKSVGMGSRREEMDIIDFDEMCRKTQKNIYRCSPIIPDSNNYYFNFYSHDLIRKINPKCVKCKDVDKCLMLPKQTDTLCKTVKFNERLGYPEKIVFRLETWNAELEKPIMRGFYEAPMPPPDFIMEYDKYKDSFLKVLEKQTPDDSFGMFKEIAKKIVKERNEDLLMDEGTKIIQSKLIEAIVYETVGMRNYTKGEIDMIKMLVINLLRQKLQ